MTKDFVRTLLFEIVCNDVSKLDESYITALLQLNVLLVFSLDESNCRYIQYIYYLTVVTKNRVSQLKLIN